MLGTNRYCVLASLLVASLPGAVAAAQIPYAPVLQNAFANSGFAFAANITNLSGATSYLGAVAWAPRPARFQLSAGVGAQTRSNEPTRTVFGGRINVGMLRNEESRLGISVFGGYGALSGSGLDSTDTKTVLPLGATVGFRLPLGKSHGISFYASPIYEWITRGGGASGASVFRGAAGIDIGILGGVGATIGAEFGSNYPGESGKPSGTAFGAAISYAFGGSG